MILDQYIDTCPGSIFQQQMNPVLGITGFLDLSFKLDICCLQFGLGRFHIPRIFLQLYLIAL